MRRSTFPYLTTRSLRLNISDTCKQLSYNIISARVLPDLTKEQRYLIKTLDWQGSCATNRNMIFAFQEQWNIALITLTFQFSNRLITFQLLGYEREKRPHYLNVEIISFVLMPIISPFFCYTANARATRVLTIVNCK